MNVLARDLRFAFRMLLKSPAFTAAAVLTLALGIGLNTATFSAVHALLLRPLPEVEEPDRLVQLYRQWSSDFLYGSNSIPHFFSLKEEADVFESVTAWTFVPLNLSEGGENERIMGEMVSADYFRTLGAPPILGRGFLPEEDTGSGQHPVVVLSHSFWQQRFGGRRDVVGETLTLNGMPFEVVGVAPPGFKGAMAAVDSRLYAPLSMQRELQPGIDRLERRGSNFMSVVARLKDGVTVPQARDAMDALMVGLREQYPGHYEGNEITLVPQSEAGIHPMFAGTQRAMSGVMMAVVGLLLLIACVNVANLFLARARDRQKEIGVRLSLGASRGAVVRQLMTEATVFALASAAAGLAMAVFAVDLLNGIQMPVDVPFEFDVTINGPVLLFTLAATVLTGLLFGLAPALTASKPELVTALKGGKEGRRSKSRATRLLVGVQVALSIVLLVSAGLFLRNLQAATALDKGFDAENLMLVSMDPSLQGYDRARTVDFYDQMLERVRQYPMVEAAGLAEVVPLGFGSQQTGVSIPGYEPGPDEAMSIDYNEVTPGYLEAMGIRLVAGRPLTEEDDENAAPVIVINQRFADRFWPGEDPIGQMVQVGSTERSVIGVVETGKYQRLSEAPLSYMYLPWAQVFNSEMTLHVRTAGPPEAILTRVREEVARLDPLLPLYDARTMESHLGITMLPARLAGTVLGIFGLLGLFLAAIGIYGVMAYSVAQRTRELGIRVALGADRNEVVRMVVRQGLGVVLIGAVVGLAGAVGAAQLIRGMLYTGNALDPITFSVVTVVLVGAATLATYVPARRAARVDPVRALKTE